MADHSSDSHANFAESLKPLEAKLAALRPIANGIDRDRLMYEAGAAATVRPSTYGSRSRWWLWPCISAAMLLVSACLATELALRGSATERIVYVSRPEARIKLAPMTDTPRDPKSSTDTASSAGLPWSDQSNFALLQRALRFGVDAIGSPVSSGRISPAPEVGNRPLLNQMLGT